jgi:divalent metal cation (Fe/Co/Zn/Cd) transporter
VSLLYAQIVLISNSRRDSFSYDIYIQEVDAEKMHAFISLVQSVTEVKRIDRIRARDHWHNNIVDVRVGIPAELSVQEENG